METNIVRKMVKWVSTPRYLVIYCNLLSQISVLMSDRTSGAQAEKGLCRFITKKNKIPNFLAEDFFSSINPGPFHHTVPHLLGLGIIYEQKGYRQRGAINKASNNNARIHCKYIHISAPAASDAKPAITNTPIGISPNDVIDMI